MKSKVLIVEDNRANLMLMQMLVSQLPNCIPVIYPDPADLVGYLEKADFDLAIIDYQMPGMNGVELIEAIRAQPRHADKPLVMVTADRDAEVRRAALHAGAVEFLNKPIEPVEFKTRIRNLVRLAEANRKLADHAAWLRDEVDTATAELRAREEEIITRLALAAGYKDEETAAHTKRMARYTGILAAGLGMDDDFCRDIQLAAPMHDVGKVGISDAVLLKQGKLTEEERREINEHTRIGAAILGGSKCELLRMAADIARAHHEHWNGNGYPAGLKGENIPLVARIAAVADVFDALTSARSYKPAWTPEKAFGFLREQAGEMFDPHMVEVFESRREEILAYVAEAHGPAEMPFAPAKAKRAAPRRRNAA